MEWEYSSLDENIVKELSKKCKLSENAIRLLLNRKLDSEEKINDFMQISVSKLRDPFIFKEMKVAVEKILTIREKKEKIVIYGDYDVDGITSAAFLTIVFRNLDINVDYYIPDRMEEGYGLNKKAIEQIKKDGGKLIITVDTGINSNDEVEYAKARNVDIIITDHHKVLKEDDSKIIIINPKTSKNYDFKFLSGAGVALKLAEAVYLELGLELKEIYKYMDIVMIGTVADVVPMIDENRVIIKEGLNRIKETKIKGLVYLLKYLKLTKKDITTTDVSFFISPMLNALGRISNSKIGVDFFMEKDDFVIYNIIEDMKKANKKRRALEREIFDDIIGKISDKVKDLEYVFLKSDKWHPGIIGVVSSRLALKYNIPIILISTADGYGKASCRSVQGINIFNILKNISEKFVRFGGHDLAAGFVAEEENLDFIKESIKEGIKKIGQKVENKKVFVDFKVNLVDIDSELIKDIRKISPFGLENSQPYFYDDEIYFTNIKKFGVENRHFKGFIKKGEKIFSAVGFNLGHRLDKMFSEAQNFEIVYYPEKVYYDNSEVIQIKVKDFKIKDEFYKIFK